MKFVLQKLADYTRVLLFVASASRLPAQSVPVVPLPAANGVLREEFTMLSVHALRELKDGRVLVTETGGASRLVSGDFKTGAVTAISRKGDGPGEYTTGIGIFALSGDSSLMIASQTRWLLLSGDRIVQTHTLTPAGGMSASLSAFDTLAHVLTHVSASPRDDDSSTVALRLRQRDGLPGPTTVTLRTASRAEPGYPPPPQPRAGGGLTYFAGAWFAVERAELLPDGWIAVIRLRPYRVDWLSPEGKWTRGTPLPVPEMPASDREKRAFLQRLADRTGAPLKSIASFPAWPKTIPPIVINPPPLGAPDGKLWIPRTATADHPEMRYDVVNRAGQLERQITIGKADRVLGFGVKSVYVSSTDDDGIQRISRHPWP